MSNEYIPLRYQILMFVFSFGENIKVDINTLSAKYPQYSKSTILKISDQLIDDRYLINQNNRLTITEDGILYTTNCASEPTLQLSEQAFKTEVRSGGKTVYGPIGPRLQQTKINNAAIPTNKHYRTHRDPNANQTSRRVAATAASLDLTIDEFVSLIAEGLIKMCTKCAEYKPISEYHKDKQKADGHITVCKTCKRILYRNKGGE